MDLPFSDIPNDAKGFQDLVRARTEERKTKTEEKRVETLKSLNNQILRNEKEARANLFGLPDLVWSGKLLPLLDDRRDVWNMWEVHPKFRELSGSSLSNECLLTQVLKISNLPHLWEYKLFRQISKSMRTSIDGIMDEHFMKILRGKSRLYDFPEPEVRITVDAPPFNDLKRMLADFCEGSVEKPAGRTCGHSLTLVWFPDEAANDESYFPELERKVRLLLERIGDQVWKFKFFVDDCQIPAEDVYHHFRFWISRMPNLKWIKLEARIDGKIDPNVIQDNPVPRLEYLERVTLEHFNPVQVQSALASAVIGPNRETIRAIEFVWYGEDEDDVLPFVTEMMPLISTLKLGMFTGYRVWTPSTLEVLKPVASTQWMLTKVWMWQFPMSLQILFNFLNSISTLEQIRLGVRDVVVGDAVPHLRLQNLVDFELTFSIASVNYKKVDDILFFTSLQFLVHSKKLKNLKWEFWTEKVESVRQFKDFLDKTGDNEMINFKCGHQKDLSRSNLWQVFPELEFLKTVVTLDDDTVVPQEIRKPRPLMM